MITKPSEQPLRRCKYFPLSIIEVKKAILVAIPTENIMLKECAIIAIIVSVEINNPGCADTKNCMPVYTYFVLFRWIMLKLLHKSI